MLQLRKILQKRAKSPRAAPNTWCSQINFKKEKRSGNPGELYGSLLGQPLLPGAVFILNLFWGLVFGIKESTVSLCKPFSFFPVLLLGFFIRPRAHWSLKTDSLLHTFLTPSCMKWGKLASGWWSWVLLPWPRVTDERCRCCPKPPGKWWEALGGGLYMSAESRSLHCRPGCSS